MSLDLNTLRIADEGAGIPLADPSASSADGGVSVYFRDLESRLVHHIARASLVVGCVAWLTSKRILDQLARVPDGVALVVQKEDFLRPDLGSSGHQPQRLRAMYDRLKTVVQRHNWPGLIGSLSFCCDPLIQPVRCLGNHNRDKQPAFPRMHHKFLVFCKTSWSADADEPFAVHPYEVWTGSFNFTRNAVASLENAVVLAQPAIADAYYREWEQLEALSEPLDWTSVWCAPEWRIGS